MGQNGHLLNPDAKVEHFSETAKFFRKFFEKILIYFRTADFQIVSTRITIIKTFCNHFLTTFALVPNC